MTKRITVSVPDDVAAHLATFANASAEVTEAVRARMDIGAATLAQLRAAGDNITEEGMARWREKIRPLTAEDVAEGARRLADMEAGRRPGTGPR